MSEVSNPSVYPHQQTEESGVSFWHGISLLDYLAARAMQALLSSPKLLPETSPSVVAQYAYGIAYAMLMQREKGAK